MGTRGLGRLYLRGGADGVWWLQIGVGGQTVRISTGIRGGSPGKPPKEAEMFRAKKLTELGKGLPIKAESITFDDLADALVARYKAERRPSLQNLINRLKPLRKYFGAWKAGAIRPSHVLAYGSERRDMDGAATATANLEIHLLVRAFNVAVEDGVLAFAPRFHILPGTNVRRGFLEEGQFRQIAERMTAWTRPVAEFLWLTGWRSSEALSLRWPMVDRESCEVRIPTSKTGAPRTLPYGSYEKLKALLDFQRDLCDRLRVQLGFVVQAVFPTPHGQPVTASNLGWTWRAAREAAGFPKAIIHDLRRSFVRRCEREGIPRSVAMAVTGHKSQHVYTRYAVTGRKDVEEGLARLNETQDTATVKKGNFG